jgi:hypothetical protein
MQPSRSNYTSKSGISGLESSGESNTSLCEKGIKKIPIIKITHRLIEETSPVRIQMLFISEDDEFFDDLYR